MNRRPVRLAFLLLAAAVLAAVGVFGAAGPPRARAAGDLLRGETAAAHLCVNCHGLDGRSQTPGVPSLAGQPPEFITLQLILFREGLRDTPPMPDFARHLSDPMIEDIAAWFSTLPPGPPDDRRPRDPALVERGRALSAELRCGICHLPDYSGRDQIPRLAGQREEYLAASLAAFRDNRRFGTDTNMMAVMYRVPDADIAALAHYLAQAE